MTDARPDQLIICRAAPNDADAIFRVLRESFAAYEHLYTGEAFRATTLSPDAVRRRMSEGPLWIAILNDPPVGTGSGVVTERGCYIRGMAVIPSVRGRRIGWMLLETLEAFAKDLELPRLYLSSTHSSIGPSYFMRHTASRSPRMDRPSSSGRRSSLC